MSSSRPGVLAIRAVNQYRRRDVLPYLALRYYLNSSAARSDHWARTAATALVLTRSDPPYFGALHFKELSEEAGVEHRRVFLPSANEALAEAALLDVCAQRRAFVNPSCVFSYHLSRRPDETFGVFQPYFGGLQKRHEQIAAACEAQPNGIVRYADIKRFYPSIRNELALTHWDRACTEGELPQMWRELGQRLIAEHAKVGPDSERGVLTGPMFSHLIGNLVLKDIDAVCAERLPARYFRYVDDITLVGDAGEVAASMALLRMHLGQIGFELHDDDSKKSIEVSAREWLEGRRDYANRAQSISWMGFVADLKQFLFEHPEEQHRLRHAFLGEGIRLPIRDYSGTVHEAAYLDVFRKQLGYVSFRRKYRRVNPQSLMTQAVTLGEVYEAELRTQISELTVVTGFSRKRRIPKARYCASRLVYLARENTLSALAREAAAIPELTFHAEVMAAVSSGHVGPTLLLGANAAQVVAQALRASNREASAGPTGNNEVVQQSLAVFALNGAPVSVAPEPRMDRSELQRFAVEGVDRALMTSVDPFVRELSCLHGLGMPRHSAMLESAFDEDEIMTMDAIEQGQDSLSQ